MNEREEIPNRRHGLRVPVIFASPSGNEVEYFVQYNLGKNGTVIECFVSQDDRVLLKTGSQFRAMIEDACKAISRLIQYGDSMETLAGYFGEDRQEGETIGPPSSPFGAIARVGAKLDARALKVIP